VRGRPPDGRLGGCGPAGLDTVIVRRVCSAPAFMVDVTISTRGVPVAYLAVPAGTKDA
jgi:hypothetical protein